MIKKIKTYILTALMALTFGAPALVPTISASAACSKIASQVGIGASAASSGDAACETPTGVDPTGIGKIAQGLVNIFSLVVGVVAVIMIIYGGFRYITSGGDSGRVGSAKNSLIYAIVGLIIVALAQLIVKFVLNQSSSITT